MPRPKRNSPVADQALRELIAPALFAEAAVNAGGCWCANQLELKVFESDALSNRKRRPKESALANDQFDATGLFKQMLGSRVPTDALLNSLTSVFSEARFEELKHHMLWKVLMEGECGDAAAADVMKRLPSAHLDSLREAVSIGFRSELHDLTRHDRLLSLGAMEALVILVASGRHVARGDQVRGFLSDPTRAVRKIFPRLVSRDPRLFIRWRTLATRLRKVLIGFRLCDGQRDTIDFEVCLEANQGRLDQIPLPPDSIVNTPAAWHEEKLKDRRVDRLVQGMLDWGSDHYLTPSTKTHRLRISLSETDPA